MRLLLASRALSRNRYGDVVALQVRHRLARGAFGPQVAGTAFALATLGGHAMLELDVVKGHAGAGALGNGFVADAVADTDDHGGR